MELKYWTDASGAHFKEVISRKYQTLVSLGNEYIKRGSRIWIHPYDICEGKWILTVKEK